MPAVFASRCSPSLAPSADPARRRRRRQDLLERVLARWLEPPTDCPRATHAPACAALARWLDAVEADRQTDPLAGLARILGEIDGAVPDPERVAATFAASLLDQAKAEVAREAQRAGHGEVHAALSPWIERDPDAQRCEALAASLQRSPAALRTALSGLRRRFRQRVESGLALWAEGPEARADLRRRLRAAPSTDTETRA